MPFKTQKGIYDPYNQKPTMSKTLKKAYLDLISPQAAPPAFNVSEPQLAKSSLIY
ncbi:hypothetical protein PMIT1327_00997 [Prochlorococcus marinus str. MIT 1327]|nr:hypothetical protein PMIT1312_01039 [Prochlorococcus marinus str. MIT 1312]KZR82223.1 hypothetical protein PMIT1327_00997 [Prochlorococcus marinus str. MIT 1327]